MFKISPKASTMLSLVLSAIFFIACIVGAFMLPTICDTLLYLRNLGTDAGADRGYVLILGYLILAVFVLIDVLLFSILLRVKREQVFSPKTVSLIRAVSFNCFVLCVLFGALGIFFKLSLVISFFAVFLGICLRVVKNVIEEATVIKTENDLTV